MKIPEGPDRLAPPRRRAARGAVERARAATALLVAALLCVLAARALLDNGGAPRDAARDAAPPGARATRPRHADDLLADVELVYGPLVAHDDVAALLARRRGALADHGEVLDGTWRTAAEIIEGVARDHSISPRLLIALVELESGAVDGPAADAALARPLGDVEAEPGLRAGLRWAAGWLNDGYYGFKHRGERHVAFADGQRARLEAPPSAAHFAVARWLALSSTPAAWDERRRAFAEVYTRLYGGAPGGAAATLPAALAQPPLLLPWSEGEVWHFTGGPHGSWGVQTAWGAVDFAPPTPVGCATAPEWAIAAAPGIVARSAPGIVVLDLDGDGLEATGWTLNYLHMAGDGRPERGAFVPAGGRIGHPSCEGGRATGAHLHLARRYDGEWLPAHGGPAPLELSGWRFASLGAEYRGSMSHPEGGTRVAVTNRSTGRTDVVSDNGPARQAALAPLWVGPPRPGASLAAVATPAPPAGVGRSPGAIGGQSGAALELTIRLEGRPTHDTPFILGLDRPAHDTVVLMGRTDRAGHGAVKLPPLEPAEYDVTLRVPGFLPSRALGVAIGPGGASLDLGRGGLAPLRAGDLTHDDTVDARDVAVWLRHWAAGRDAADIDDDGRAGWTDLRRIVRNLRE